VDDQKVSSCAILRPDGAACAGASTLSLFPQAPHGPPPPPEKTNKKKNKKKENKKYNFLKKKKIFKKIK